MTNAKDEGSPDLIESLVGKLFGRAALEDRAPAGMKRLDNPESESLIRTQSIDSITSID